MSTNLGHMSSETEVFGWEAVLTPRHDGECRMHVRVQIQATYLILFHLVRRPRRSGHRSVGKLFLLSLQERSQP